MSKPRRKGIDALIVETNTAMPDKPDTQTGKIVELSKEENKSAIKI